MASNTIDANNVQAQLAGILAAPIPQREASFYAPQNQPYYAFTGTQWEPIVAGAEEKEQKDGKDGKDGAENEGESENRKISGLTLISWNIDMLIPAGKVRMAAALEHLKEVVSRSDTNSSNANDPTVVFLQEITAEDLELIQAADWVRDGFYLSDVSGQQRWPAGCWYGTVTLLGKEKKGSTNGGWGSVKGVFRVPWESRFERDGLFVDVEVEVAGGDGENKNKTLLVRLCNTHLESLVADPPVRPGQLQKAAKYLNEEKVHVALLAGDLNSIQPFDKTLHSENGLEDAFLALGGEEGTDDGFTWGYQCPAWMRERFGCTRMDKVFYRGAVKAVGLERIGVDVKIKGEELGEEERKLLFERGGGDWVTDHYGLRCRLEFV